MDRLSYRQLRDLVIARRNSTVALELRNEASMAHYAAIATDAYAWAAGTRSWGFLRETAEFAVTGGLVSVPTASDAFCEFFTADPRPHGSGARRLQVMNRDADGFWLAEDVASCWVSYEPRPMRFTHVAWTAGTHAVGALVYYEPTGECYECIAAATTQLPTDTTKWKAQSVPIQLTSPITFYMLAEIQSNRDEQGQYGTLIAKAENALTDAFRQQYVQPLYGY